MECIVNVVTKSGIRHMLPTPVFLGFPWGLASKESTCNVGDLGSIPGLGRSPGEGKGYSLQYSGLENSMDCVLHVIIKSERMKRRPTPIFSGFPCGLAGKESAWNVGDPGSIPGLGRFPGEGKGYPLQYSGLENSMDFRYTGEGKGLPTPVFWPGEFHGLYHPCGHKLWEKGLDTYFSILGLPLWLSW